MASSEKTIEKEWDKISKTVFKKEQWNRASWATFKQKGDFLYSFRCSKINKKNEVVVYLEFKPATIDFVFWDIVHLQKNKNAPLSLRVIGAWSLSGIPVANWTEIVDPGDPQLAFESVLKQVNQHIKTISHISDLAAFIEHISTQNDQPFIMPMLVTCLIQTNQLQKALELTDREIKNKESGGFATDGRTYYQQARDEILKRMRQEKINEKQGWFKKLFS